MDGWEGRLLSRRRMLAMGIALPVPLVLAACGSGGAASKDIGPRGQAAGAEATISTGSTPSPAASAVASAATLSPTPACGDDDDEPTLAQTEGPYFTPGSPERASLMEPGMTGTKLLVSGLVVTTGCRPVARALLDFWQADDKGDYDNKGFRLRGHQFTDAQGRYRLETILPGLYTGRTRHIHVKVQAPGGRVLTTQLYFPNEPANARDGIFRSELVMKVRGGAGGQEGSFTFVLEG